MAVSCGESGSARDVDDPWSAGDDVCETSDMAHTPVLATEASRLLSDGSADRFRFASGSIDQVSYKKSGPVSQVPESLVYNKLSGLSRNMRVHAMSTTGHSRRGENRKPPLQATKVRPRENALEVHAGLGPRRRIFFRRERLCDDETDESLGPCGEGVCHLHCASAVM